MVKPTCPQKQKAWSKTLNLNKEAAKKLVLSVLHFAIFQIEAGRYTEPDVESNKCLAI
jgi:nitrite reductase/ring-hydroxylating ferredoxin subunit